MLSYHPCVVLTGPVPAEQSAREIPGAIAPGAPQPGHAAYTAANYSNHSQPGPGINRTSPASAAHPLAHGYPHAQIPQNEAHLHPELRSTNEPSAAAPVYPPIPTMIQPGPGQAMSGPLAPVAPAVGAVETEEGPDGRKAKRELSQSKRAAQNRAAQVSSQNPLDSSLSLVTKPFRTAEGIPPTEGRIHKKARAAGSRLQ